MRTAAQVRECIVLIDRNLRLLFQRIAIFIQSAFFESFDQLHFIGLVGKDLLRLFGRDDRLLELMLALHDLSHALFDLLPDLRA